MPAGPREAEAQATFANHLRYAIDTARKYPTTRNRQEAIAMAKGQPLALRSSHVRHNLGKSRWEWLATHGVYPIGEEGEIEGSFKATITPEIKT
jgi:hypothetical protein